MESASHTAVLVVHGIGNQKPGQTVDAFVRAFRGAVPQAQPSQTDSLVLEYEGRSIRFYEVYWADILEGAKTRGSFDIDVPSIISWFPLLNLRRGEYDRTSYPLWLVILWTLVLVPIGIFYIFLYYGARFA